MKTKHRSWTVSLIAALCVLGAPFGRAALGQPIPAYPVSNFEFSYLKPLPGLPNPEDFQDIEVELSQVIDGWVGPDREGERMTVTLGELALNGAETVYPSAMRAIQSAIAEAYPNLNLFVAPSEEDVDPRSGADLRPAGETTMRMKVAFEGPFYEISRFVLHYAVGDHPGQVPPSEILDNVTVMLTPADEGFVTWRPLLEPVPFRLGDLTGETTERFSAMSVQLILEAIRDYLTLGEDYMGVWARPAPGELAADLSDARQDRTEFHIEIITGFVSSVRTIARGDRVPVDDSVNNPVHDAIKENSPIQPSSREQLGPESVLRRGVLDDYLYRMSRHPGRRVDVAVAPGIDPFSLTLDYLVTENKPLMLYVQAGNTGTEQTDDWRYRFGIFDNQLTGNDDILNLEFVTADFDDNNAVTGSYEGHIDDIDGQWRWRAFGFWSEFEASEVGFANERFTGESWGLGAEVLWNFFQDRQLFLDLIAGVRFANHDVDNALAGVSGDEDFVIPYVGLQVERNTVEAQTNALITLDLNPDITSVDEDELNALGRLFPDEETYVLHWDMQQTFYLEPLLNREAWEDVTTPESSTLAHEIALRFRGQYAFDKRLIPQQEQTVGGFYTVRGYPESVAVGDTALIGTVEYRFHLPRALGVDEEPMELFNEPFRIVPQQPYGVADWDLIFRGFFDIGRTMNSDRFSFERNETLVGAGIGVEFAYKTNLNVRLDWGFALDEIEGEVSEGSSQVHFVASLFF